MATTTLQKITTHQQYLSLGIPSADSLLASPIAQFSSWFDRAKDNVHEPEAFALSTVSSTGIPSSRIVLLKTVDDLGFVFFTNYESRKGKELFGSSEKPGYASMAFYWRETHQQVRVVGRVEKVSAEETKEYFNSRPVGSRIGAWASKQSSVLQGGREELEAAVENIEKRFGVKGDGSFVDVGPDGEAKKDAPAKGSEVPVPPFWGGVRIVPFEVEFWMGRESRLHDRFRYTRPEGDTTSSWKIERLAP